VAAEAAGSIDQSNFNKFKISDYKESDWAYQSPGKSAVG
jgi:hypothetical protein